MLRIIVRTDDAGAAANVGGAVWTTFKTFDIHAPEIEAFVSERFRGGFVGRQVVGVECVAESASAQETK